MRILLAELAPLLGEPDRNLDRLDAILAQHPSDLAVFPELYESGYRVGDRVAGTAIGPGSPSLARLADIARRRTASLVLGAPYRAPGRSGEIWNAALAVGADGGIAVQGKRFLPTFGPFEEGTLFAPVPTSRPVPIAGRSVGLQICYDAFFPEVSRELALAGAELLVVISAAPVTSRRLFERILPARAIENAVPLVYVNRTGVEEGLVFGGGSVALDARGEEIAGRPVTAEGLGEEERVLAVEIDPSASHRWRRFRPVLRDVAPRRAPSPEGATRTPSL